MANDRSAAAHGWSLPVALAVAGGIFFLVSGLWAFAAPASFFEVAAPFEPYNAHFVRDIGAFQVGLGAVLLLGTRIADGLTVALAGVGLGSLVHTVGHVLDRDLGGRPELDIPFLVVLSVALLAGAALRRRA